MTKVHIPPCSQQISFCLLGGMGLVACSLINQVDKRRNIWTEESMTETKIWFSPSQETRKYHFYASELKTINRYRGTTHAHRWTGWSLIVHHACKRKHMHDVCVSHPVYMTIGHQTYYLLPSTHTLLFEKFETNFSRRRFPSRNSDRDLHFPPLTSLLFSQIFNAIFTKKRQEKYCTNK